LRTTIIAGAANNQLAQDKHGVELIKRGILYAPDYVINAGGIMNIANEIHGRAVSTAKGMKDVESIYNVLLEIYHKADTEGRPTGEISDEIARAKIKKISQNRAQKTKAA
jgi:leucine dehydrogenase